MTEADYIKAQLDLLKIFVTATIGAMFVIAVHTLQTPEFNINTALAGTAILGILLVVLCIRCFTLTKKLK